MPGELWVDYDLLKEEVSIEMVLQHYSLMKNMTRKGSQLTSTCPIHRGSGKHRAQFSVNTEDNRFQCFSCKAKGNQIHLAGFLEGIFQSNDDRRDDEKFRHAALMVKGWFGLNHQRGPRNGYGSRSSKTGRTKSNQEASEAKIEKQLPENQPLDFQLKLDSKHPYLTDRGLTSDTVLHFGLGFSSRGSMKGRIAIPIHNPEGCLVGYAGRSVEDELPEGEGKYKLPASFRKSLEVFNIHRIPPEAKHVILVEGYFSVFWLHQCGFSNVVSLMGSTISLQQVDLLKRNFKGALVFFDGDDSGIEGSNTVALKLFEHMWVKIIRCPAGLQPDRLPAHELRGLLP